MRILRFCQVVALISSSAVLAGCGAGGGSCSGLELTAIAKEVTNLPTRDRDLYLMVKNSTNEPRLVTASAVDPNGQERTVGPFRVGAKDVHEVKVYGIKENQGRTHSEIVRSGWRFAFKSCE